MEVNNKSYYKELTNDESLLLKGIAIILMVGYHLFCFPERLHFGSYISLIPINFLNNTAEKIIFSQGKICVAIFLFLSGYGMYITYDTKNENIWKFSFTRLKKFYINYWIVFFLFIPLGYILFNIDLKSNWIFIKNILILDSTYNGEWWFAKYYVILLVLFPLILASIKKSIKLTLIIAVVLCLTYKVHLVKLFVWQFPFVIGVIFSNLKIYSKVKFFSQSIKYKNILAMIGIAIVVLVRIFIGEYLNVFTDYGLDGILVPIIIGFIIIIKIPKGIVMILKNLGKHSGNIWLTHTFFAYYYIQKVVFYPKLSILIIIWVFILSILSSMIIFKLSEKIFKIKNKVWRKNVS